MEGESLLRTMHLLSRHLPKRWESDKTDDNIFSPHFNINIIFLIHVLRQSILITFCILITCLCVNVQLTLEEIRFFWSIFTLGYMLCQWDLYYYFGSSGTSSTWSEKRSCKLHKRGMFLHVFSSPCKFAKAENSKFERLVQEILYKNNSLYLARKYINNM